MTVVPELEFKAGEHTYRVTRLSVFDQMNLAAEFRDIISGLAMLKRDRPKELDDKAFEEAVKFIMTSRGGVSSEARERVMHLCFRQVSRQSGVGWAAIQTPDGTMAFDDIRLPESVIIMYNVFEHNRLLDFFFESPSSSEGGQTTASGPVSMARKTG